MSDVHPFFRSVFDEITGGAQSVNLATLVDYLNALRMEVDTAKQANLDLLARLATQAQAQAQTAQLLHLVIGGDAVAQSLATLYQLLQQDMASDSTTAADLLAKINTVAVVAAGAATNVQLARGVADAALATTQQQATTLSDLGQKVAEKLPLSGGTLTGPLNVLAPSGATNPLQLSSLPLSMTFQQPLPLIALGGLYSFTVAVTNATVGQVVVLNLPPTMLSAGASYVAAVTAAGTVTITLKAGAAIAAGTQTFYLRVLR
jgi:ubiquinone biosynthesis protein UbiJ